MALRDFEIDGIEWQVWDTVPAERSVLLGAVATGMEQGWLTFECPVEKRRLFPIPPGWVECSPAELERLWMTAEVIPLVALSTA